MNVYGTHLPILKSLFSNNTIKTVLELGVGDASTPFFLGAGVTLTSVESDVGWATKYSHEVITGSSIEFLKKDARKFDLAFVDSNPASERYQCVELLFGKANIIVVHDTEPESDWNYGFSKIKLPNNYTKVDFKEEIPWTSVYSLIGVSTNA